MIFMSPKNTFNRSIAAGCLLFSILAAGSSGEPAVGLISSPVGKVYAGLPEVEPPFKAKEHKLQPVTLTIGNIVSSKGMVNQPYLVCGNKKIASREGGRGPDATGKNDHKTSVLIDGKLLAWFQINGFIPGVGFGYPFKARPGSTPEIVPDKDRQGYAYVREYQLGKDETAVYRQSLRVADLGKILFDYDMGIAPERFSALPKRSEMVPQCFLEKNAWDLGVSIDGVRLKPTPLEDFKKLPKNHSGAIHRQLKTIENCHEISVSPDNPAAGFTLRLTKPGRVIIYENYYQKQHRLILSLPCDPEKVRGSFLIDLGVSKVADKNAPPPVAGVDFWKHDRMHLPAPTTRNLMPNPSFEQGLRYWTWFKTGSAKHASQPGNPPCYQVGDEAKFGCHSLKCNGTWGNRPLQSFPFPVLQGKTYTVSFYAKAVAPTKFTLGVGTMIGGGKPSWREAIGKSWRVGTDWQRYSYTLKANSPALQVFFQGPWKETVFLDGLQIEAGTRSTDFISPAVEGRLVTADPDNSLQPGEAFNAAIELSGVSGAAGEMSLVVFDFYRQKVFEGKCPFSLNQNGLGKVSLPLDGNILGQGVFVVKADYRIPGQQPIVDYYRLSIMDYLAKKHATSEFFGNSCCAAKISRGDEIARQFVRWGWGAKTDGGDLSEVFSNNGLTDYCAMISENLNQEQRQALWGENYKAYGWHGAPKFNVKLDVISSDDKLKLIEQFSYEIARKYPHQKRWAWDGELDGRSERIRHGDFSEYAKIIIAMHRGIKRANPDAIVLPDQGPASATVLEQVSKILSSTKDKVRWDAVAIHHYNYCDLRDERTADLIATMRKEGYGDTPIYLTEGSGGSSTYYVPEWNKNPWDNRAGRPSYDTSWKEFLSASFAARAYLNSLKYWPQVQFVTLWSSTPFLDLNFSPWMLCKSVNTLGHLFGDPAFVADIRPIEDVKGMAFEAEDGRGLIAVWTTGEDGDVERGLKQGARLRVDFGAETPEFIDLMGNVRRANPVNGRYEIPLSPAPLFVRGSKGSATKLAAALNQAEVVGGGSTVRAEVFPGLDGALTATLANKTARPLAGKLTVGRTSIPFKIPASDKTTITLQTNLPTTPGKIRNWKDIMTISMDDGSSVDITYSLAWFFVPKVPFALPLNPDAPAWKSIPAVPLANWYQHAAPKTDDLKAAFQMAWDDKNLYLRVEAEDDDFVLSPPDMWRPQPSSLYSNDGCVEVYFDSFANARGNLKRGHDDDDYRYDFFAGSEKAVDGPGSIWRLYRAFEQYAGGIAQPGDQDCASGRELKCEFRRTDGRYAYVMVFPLRYIMPIKLEKGGRAGFGLYLHDKEPGEKWPQKGLSLATEPGKHCNFRPDLYPLMILK
jgi:hypothetical protein